MSEATRRGDVTVIDAGVGNLGNLARALRHVSAEGHLGAEVEVTSRPGVVEASRCLVLPGVGAFAPPRETLRGALEGALRSALEQGAWLLGICVGFQLLFDAGEEFGTTDGLGLLPGRVTRLPDGVPLPHIGWNRLHDLAQPGGDGDGRSEGRLLAGLDGDPYVYFVHSFAPEGVPQTDVLARSTHGRAFPAAVGRGRVLGTQFHPEKSGGTGLKILANFLEMAGVGAVGGEQG